MEDQTNNRTKTTDIYIAAYLMANGGTLIGSETSSRGQVEFELEVDNMPDMLTDFYNNKGMVSAKKNKATLLELKDYIFSNSNN